MSSRASVTAKPCPALILIEQRTIVSVLGVPTGQFWLVLRVRMYLTRSRICCSVSPVCKKAWG